MAGLVPAIPRLLGGEMKFLDAGHKAGHDKSILAGVEERYFAGTSDWYSATICLPMTSAENFSSTSSRARLPKRARISPSPAICVRALASAGASSTGKV